MRNKVILIMLMAMVATGVFFGCTDSGNTVNETETTKAEITQAETEAEEIKEYRMRDIEEKLTRISEKLEQDLTKEELDDEKVFAEAWSKECKNEGLPVDEKIRISGVVSDITNGDSDSTINILLEGSGGFEYTSGRLQCSFERKRYPQIIFAERDTNIVIEGIFSKNGKTFGMTDCEVISPEIKEHSFLNNILDVTDGAYTTYDTEEFFYKSNVDIYGQVNKITFIDDETRPEIKEFFRNEEEISTLLEIFECLLYVGDEEGTGGIFILCTKEEGEELSIGDKIYMNTYLYRTSYVEENTRYISVYTYLFSDPMYIYD